MSWLLLASKAARILQYIYVACNLPASWWCLVTTSRFLSCLLNAYSHFLQQFCCGNEGSRARLYVERRKQTSCLGFLGYVVGRQGDSGWSICCFESKREEREIALNTWLEDRNWERKKKSQLFLCFCKEREVWTSLEGSKCFLGDTLSGIHILRDCVALTCWE